jgi:phage shock protein A
MSQRIEQDWLTEESIREHINAGGTLLNNEQARVLLDEIDRLRKECYEAHQAGLDIDEENDQLRKENAEQAQRMKEILLKAERLEKLVPPEIERGPGFVGQGSWSVFAEKVVAERDYLQDALKQTLSERDDARDELNTLCEDIRALKEENDELREGMRLLGNATASKKEHTSIDTNGDEPLEISGYGKFKLMRTTVDSQWMLFLNKENIMLYNRKGRRVRAKFTEW